MSDNKNNSILDSMKEYAKVVVESKDPTEAVVAAYEISLRCLHLSLANHDPECCGCVIARYIKTVMEQLMIDVDDIKEAQDRHKKKPAKDEAKGANVIPIKPKVD